MPFSWNLAKKNLFLLSIANSLFLPYLTLQMVQTGLDLEEIAIIYAALPFVTFIVPPLAGKVKFHFQISFINF